MTVRSFITAKGLLRNNVRCLFWHHDILPQANYYSVLHNPASFRIRSTKCCCGAAKYYSLPASYPLRQAVSRLCQARSLGNKYKAQQLLAPPYRLTAYCNHADGIGCDDCSRFLRLFLRATLPAASHPHIGTSTSMAPPSLLPASAANEQGTGTGVSNCCAIKELACSRFEQLPRMRLTTRDAPFLRSSSPDLPLAIEISIADDTELMDTSNESSSVFGHVE
jgi:hypothetical protein